MKVIYISGAASNETLNEFTTKFSNNKQQRYVQQWWDYSFAKGLLNLLNDDLKLISFPAISTFPIDNCWFFKGKRVKDEHGVEIEFLSLFNLPVVKQIFLLFSTYKCFYSFLKKNKNEEIIILTHCIYPQSAIPAFILRKFYKNVKVCAIVPDLPAHSQALPIVKNFILNKLHLVYKSVSIRIQKNFDAYVCFSDYQMKYLNMSSPHIVMEGFIDTTIFKQNSVNQYSNKYIIMYAGGIAKRYGICTLVDAFIKANLPNSELHLYGQGDAEEYVKGKELQNVFFKGCVSRSEVVSLEQSCSLLVNPRPSTDEYSKCSFPSKLMEYLATGVPVLTTHLECISDEYDSLFNYIEDETIDGMSIAISNCYFHKEDLVRKAKKAARYIKEFKNVNSQATLVFEFLKRI